jgi:hypothetical protein
VIILNKSKVLRRLSKVIHTDAKQVEMWDFLATHSPFKNLKYTNDGNEIVAPQIISEEKFFKNKVLNRVNKDQFMVVQGDNGTGKSHFIRWIKEKFVNQSPSGEEVIFIARSQNTLRGALEQIINSEVFTNEFRQKNLDKLINANENLSEDYLKNNLIHQFAIASENYNKNEKKQLGKRWEKHQRRVHAFLVDKNIKKLLLKENGPIERIKTRLSAEDENKRYDEIEAKFYADDFKISKEKIRKLREDGADKNAFKLADDLNNPISGSDLREKLAKFLNNKLEAVVQKSTNLSAADLKKVFEDLRIELKKQGKNLTLFIEDITSFTGIDKALVDVLTPDVKNKEFCRIFSLVGVTTAYFRNYFPTNFKDRISGRVLINDAALTSKEEITKMAARYINAINLDSKDLKLWLENGAIKQDMPVAKVNLDKKWALIKLNEDKKLSIFPFNVNALWNLYNQLPHKTPRVFLNQIVKRFMRLYLSSNKFPPEPEMIESSKMSLPALKPLHDQKIKAQAPEDYKHINTLLRVWGDGTAFGKVEDNVYTVGGVQENIFKNFGLKMIDGLKNETENENLSNNQDYSTTNGKKYEQESSNNIEEKNKKNKEFEIMQKKLEDWSNGEPLKDYIKLRDDVANFFSTFIDWQFEEVPGYLVRSFFKQKNRISIEGQVGTYNEGFQMKRNDKSKYALLALAAWRILGNKSWDFRSSINYLNNLTHWALDLKEEIIKAVKAPPEMDSSSWNLEEWSLISEFYTQLILGKLEKEDTIKNIYQKMMNEEMDFTLEDGRSDEWFKLQKKLKRKKDFSRNHELVFNHYNCIQGDLTKEKSNRVYFIDAVPILKKLENLKERDWSFEDSKIPEISKYDSGHIWYVSFSLITYLKNKVEVALEGEEKEIKKRIKNLEKLVDAEISKENVQKLFENMNIFLQDTLKNINEAYSQENFEELLNGDLNWKELTKVYYELEELTESQDKKIKMLSISSHPLKRVKPYIELLKNMEDLVKRKKDKFAEKLEKHQEELGDYEEIKEEIEDVLLDLKKEMNSISH